MRISPAVGKKASTPRRTCHRHARPALTILASALSALALFGCAGDYSQQAPRSATPPRAASIALPDRALLKRPAQPDCSLKAAQAGPPAPAQAPTRVASLGTDGQSVRTDSEPPASTGTVAQAGSTLVQAQSDASLVQRIKLEYERDCYKRAETRVRLTLRRLQEAVEKSAKPGDVD